MALINLILEPIGRKIGQNMADKKRAQLEMEAAVAVQSAFGDGPELTPEMQQFVQETFVPKGAFYKRWWSIEEQKNKGQATFTFFMYVLIIFLLTKLALIPFSGDVYSVPYMVVDKGPSTLASIAIVFTLIMNRKVTMWKMGIALLVAAVGGLMGPIIGLLPMIGLLQKPVAGGSMTTTMEE